jgi:thiaminase/transcriptional activator TenA
LTSDEDDYFARAFDALDVPAAERRDPALTATTEAFCDLLLRGALEGGYAETLAVLLPVEWIYLEWASARADASPERFYLAEWIDLHALAEFEAFVRWLREEVDREGPALSSRRQRRVARHFRRAVALEVAFFDAAYDEPPVGDHSPADDESPGRGDGVSRRG